MLFVVFGKKIALDDLQYWNVELQEAYFSYVEASKKGTRRVIHFHPLCDQIHCEGFFNIIFSSHVFNEAVISSIVLSSSNFKGLKISR